MTEQTAHELPFSMLQADRIVAKCWEDSSRFARNDNPYCPQRIASFKRLVGVEIEALLEHKNDL